MSKPELVKVQLAAEFVLPDGRYKTPGRFGPIEMTARDWAEFDLQTAMEAAVAQVGSAEDRPALKPNRATRRSKTKNRTVES